MIALCLLLVVLSFGWLSFVFAKDAQKQSSAFSRTSRAASSDFTKVTRRIEPDPGWTELDDRQLTRLLEDSAP